MPESLSTKRSRHRPEPSRRAREDARLLERYQRTGDPAARAELTERFLPLARSLARRYERGGESLDDLTQVASLGLLKAIDRFDPQRAVAFSSFAVPTIVGELKRYFRDYGWSVRVPRGLQELALRAQRNARRSPPSTVTPRPPRSSRSASASTSSSSSKPARRSARAAPRHWSARARTPTTTSARSASWPSRIPASPRPRTPRPSRG